MALIEVDGLSKSFGRLQALADVSFDVDDRSLVALIGPNGAGKTTLFNVVTGVERPTGGQVRFDGRSLAGRGPHQIARLGIRRTFQNVRITGRMSVLENVLTGLHAEVRSGWWRAGLGLPSVAREERQLRERAREALDFVGLLDVEDRIADGLPYGKKRLLEIGRAVVARPRALLLDEPAAGLNEAETRDLSRLLRRVVDTGIPVLLIEHDMRLVMNVAEHIVVLNYGQKIAEGPPHVIQRDPGVIEAYLGTKRRVDAARH